MDSCNSAGIPIPSSDIRIKTTSSILSIDLAFIVSTFMNPDTSTASMALIKMFMKTVSNCSKSPNMDKFCEANFLVNFIFFVLI